MMKSPWPNQKKVAVSIVLMFETWAENAAPNYSTQTTHLKPGTFDHGAKAWSTYGGRVGVWRLIRLLDRFGVKGTFMTNSQCAEDYPEAVKQIVASGHDIAAHAVTQDQLLAYQTLEGQQEIIRKCVDTLEAATGRKMTGWGCPVIAFTPETNSFVAKAGLLWTQDVTYSDMPIRIETQHGPIIGLPAPDFTDNRVLRASPRDFVDVYMDTFDYLANNEEGGMLVIGVHCHFGGRPLMTAALEKVLKHITGSPDAWMATHGEIAQWAKNTDLSQYTYKNRFF